MGLTSHCPHCKQDLPVDRFHKNPKGTTKDGLQSYCKDCNKACRHKYKATTRNWHLQSTYGISLEQYNELLDAQGGGCAICGLAETNMTRSTTANPLSVDHCHESGAVRGLLCNLCNTALGKFKDDTALLEAAVDYLRSAERLVKM